MKDVDEQGRQVFEAFARARIGALLRYGHLLTGDPHAAEDLVQSALAKSLAAWRRIERDDPEAYVRRCMVNEAISHTRRRAWRERAVDVLPERPVEDATNDDRAVVMRALAELPPRQRAVLVLRYYEDRSEEEIASMLGIARGTVKSQASKGLAHLRSSLDRMELLA
ncbi:MAG TPA: SigE family RNA polymerase sigma factor [Mycobacteriales bacterium]|nr:SigE family RNA polymerase sigma factor [Mycobacteriales bacterium]